LVLLLGLSITFAHQCTYNSTKGYTYDFTRMRNLGDLSIRSESIGTYYFQVCSEVVSHCGKDVEAAICIKTANNVSINAGKPDGIWGDRKDNEDEGVTIIYSHGDFCGTDKSRRKTIVTLQCSLDQFDPFSAGSYISSVTDDGCTARMVIFTPYACPTNANFTTCDARMMRDECVAGPTHCSWCNNRCMVSRDCFTVTETSTVVVLPLFTILMIATLLSVLCCCVCCASRRRTLKKKLDTKFRLPVRHNGGYEEMAMEPMMQSPVMEPQFMYVQYPMPTGQQNPPYYAPNPVFVVPQYAQNMQ